MLTMLACMQHYGLGVEARVGRAAETVNQDETVSS
jgi:hypothetical protein